MERLEKGDVHRSPCLVETSRDRHLPRERAGEAPSGLPGGPLDLGVQEEQAVPRGSAPPAQVVEERLFGPQDLDGARWEARKPVETPGL
jgi:hypothetical protein